MLISALIETIVDPASQLKPTPSRHRFEKPIHNVKKLASPRARRTAGVPADLVSSSLDIWLVRFRLSFSEKRDSALDEKLVEPIGIEPMT
jgi:hypothetical protein